MPYPKFDSSEAERILLGIIQENGGFYEGRTRLYKAFYDAHLFYWRETGTALTTHPVVHMPNGPGIDKGSEILAKLEREGRIVRRQRNVGPYKEDVYQLCAGEPVALSIKEKAAIESAIEWVGNKTASQISRESHERSRTWRDADERGGGGKELHIFLDTLSEEAFERKKMAVEQVRELWE